MADSDGEYVADDLSDDDIEAHHIAGAGGHGTRSTGQLRGPLSSITRGGDRETGGNRRRAAWEDIQRSWDTVVEGADGSINSTVEGLREAGKRKRSAKLLNGICSI
jgi:transcription initiation factor TFIIH subunit 2